MSKICGVPSKTRNYLPDNYREGFSFEDKNETGKSVIPSEFISRCYKIHCELWGGN